MRGHRSPFASALIQLRMTRGWLRKDLAKEVGVSPNTIMNWELDKRDISAGQLANIAKVFRTSMDNLWYGKDMD